MAKLFLGPALITNAASASSTAAINLAGVQYNSTFTAPTVETWATSATATAADTAFDVQDVFSIESPGGPMPTNLALTFAVALG